MEALADKIEKWGSELLTNPNAFSNKSRFQGYKQVEGNSHGKR